MISKPQNYQEAYVWIWLPDTTEPIVAGVLEQEGTELVFSYAKSYLQKTKAIAIYDKELPLQSGQLPLLAGLNIPGCLRDGSPDAWGRRVLINKKFGTKGDQINIDSLSELTYMLESGSDRIGALDFQLSPKAYESRDSGTASLDILVQSAELVDKGVPLPQSLDKALFHGTAIGGARPKALIDDHDKKYIAKFSSTSDTYSVIKAEYIGMKLAEVCGINVAKAKLVKAAQKDVLMIERFDRVHSKKGWSRKSMVSALTMLGLDENLARYASYQDLSEIIRIGFTDAKPTLKELFARIVFNILIGNTDDHARNHAAFWNGSALTLTPAYDLCPQLRTGGEVNQAMSIQGEDRRSQLAVCLDAASVYLLSRKEAFEIVENLLVKLVENWDDICEEAKVSIVDKNLFQERQFLNAYAFERLEGDEENILMSLRKKFKQG